MSLYEKAQNIAENVARKKEKENLPPAIKKRCHQIIHTAASASGGVGFGLAQIPFSDAAVIVPTQIAMIISLGEVFDLHITESTAKGLISSMAAMYVGKGVVGIIGPFPALGNAVNAVTAAGITEFIGWTVVNNFHQRWIEDKRKGFFDGEKEGYNRASKVYDKKFDQQEKNFQEREEKIKKEIEKYVNKSEE